MGRHTDTVADLAATARRFAGRRRGLPAPQVLVRAPGIEFASGERTQPFHAASVGKMLTATLAFQLAESGVLDLTAPLSALLPRADTDGLFVRDGTDAAASVTPLHLLTHTSGVADYFEGPNDTGQTFIARVTAERDRLFTVGQDPDGRAAAGQIEPGAPAEIGDRVGERTSAHLDRLGQCGQCLRLRPPVITCSNQSRRAPPAAAGHLVPVPVTELAGDLLPPGRVVVSDEPTVLRPRPRHPSPALRTQATPSGTSAPGRLDRPLEQDAADLDVR